MARTIGLLTVLAGFAGLAGLAVAIVCVTTLPINQPDVTSSASTRADTPVAATGISSTGKPNLASITDGRPPTDEEAIAFLQKDHEFTNLETTIVKHSTIGQLSRLTDTPLGYQSDDPVLIVTGIGTFVPSATTQVTYRWGTFVIDAESGGFICVFSEHGDVPPELKP